MRALGWVLALFGAGGLVTGVFRLVHAMHVEPMGAALLALMTAGGVLLIWLEAFTAFDIADAACRVARSAGTRLVPPVRAEPSSA